MSDQDNAHNKYGELGTVSEAAERIIALTSEHRAVYPTDILESLLRSCIKQHVMLGWKDTNGEYIVPLEQFGPDNGATYPEMEEIITLYGGDCKRAWWFLNKPRDIGGRVIRPIDALKEAQQLSRYVVGCAQGYRDGGF